MKEYTLITVIKGSNRNAGPKAPRDIADILKQTDKVETVLLEAEEHRDYPLFLRLLQQVEQIQAASKKMILQYPLQPFSFFEHQELFAKAYSYFDPDRTILWIHDINKIRSPQRLECRNEMEWLKPFRHFIVHNTAMEKYMRKYIPMGTYIRNGVFDYLCMGGTIQKIQQDISMGSVQVVFAGNLIREKSPFLYDLDSKKMNFRLNVYGKREELMKNGKIYYQGNFSADLLPSRLRGDLGLIWDGGIDSADISTYKNYTRYNTPHKFSCYMAAGLPVIAWREAAIAEVIQKYQVGYLIDNLYEINSLDLSRYPEYQRNAQDLGEKVRSGYFTKRVFAQIEERWNDLWF